MITRLWLIKHSIGMMNLLSSERLMGLARPLCIRLKRICDDRPANRPLRSGKLYFEHLPWTSLPLEPIQVQKLTSEHQSMGASLHFHSCTHSHKYRAKKKYVFEGGVLALQRQH